MTATSGEPERSTRCREALRASSNGYPVRAEDAASRSPGFPYGPVRAVILAAGLGSRLLPLTGDRPKALVPVGGVPMLAAHLAHLARPEVSRVVVVAGHGFDHVARAVAEARAALPPGSPEIAIARNDRPGDTGSGTSLHLGLLALDGGAATGVGAGTPAGDPLVFMDADLVYDPAVLGCAVTFRGDGLLAGEGDPADQEAVKVQGRDRRVLELSKRPSARHAFLGESVGIVRVQGDALRILREHLAGRVARNDLQFEWEEAISSIAPDIELAAVPISPLPWIEVDTAADLARAERDVLPRVATTWGRPPPPPVPSCSGRRVG